MKDRYFTLFLVVFLVTCFFVFDLYATSKGDVGPMSRIMAVGRGIIQKYPNKVVEKIDEIIPMKKRNINLRALYEKLEGGFLALEKKMVQSINGQIASIEKIGVYNQEFYDICKQYDEALKEINQTSKLAIKKLDVLSEQWVTKEILLISTGLDQNVENTEIEIFNVLSSFTQEREAIALGLKKVFRFIEQNMVNEGKSVLDRCTNTFGCVKKRVRALDFELTSTVKKLVQPADRALDRIIVSVRSLDYENRIYIRNLDWLRDSFREGSVDVVEVFSALTYGAENVEIQRWNTALLSYFSRNEQSQNYYDNLISNQQMYAEELKSYVYELKRNIDLLKDTSTNINFEMLFDAHDSLIDSMDTVKDGYRENEKIINEGILSIETEKNVFLSVVLETVGIDEAALNALLHPEAATTKEKK